LPLGFKRLSVDNLQATIPSTGYDRSRTDGECRIFELFGSTITSDARRTREIKSRTAMTKAALIRRLFTSKLNLNSRKKLAKCYIWSVALCGAETWTLRKVEQKYLESSEMWCWRRMETISWTDRVRNEEVLHRAKEERNILHAIKRRKANWMGHIFF
jgi:hypothetical protein